MSDTIHRCVEATYDALTCWCGWKLLAGVPIELPLEDQFDAFAEHCAQASEAALRAENADVKAAYEFNSKQYNIALDEMTLRRAEADALQATLDAVRSLPNRNKIYAKGEWVGDEFDMGSLSYENGYNHALSEVRAILNAPSVTKETRE